MYSATYSKPESQSNELLQADIEVLKLSLRPYNALKRAGIKRVDDLVARSAEEIYEIRNIGKQSFEEIQAKLETYLESGLTPLCQNNSEPNLSISPQHLRWENLQSRLHTEVRECRLHPKIHFERCTISAWLQSNEANYSERELKVVCKKFDLHLKSSTINDELQELTELMTDRQLTTVSGRFGLVRQTLQEIADGIGVTRERVRQLETRTQDVISKWLHRRSPWRIQTALLFAEEFGEQISLGKWEAMLKERGLLKDDSSQQGVTQKIKTLKFLLAVLKANADADKPALQYSIPGNLLTVLDHPGLTTSEIKAAQAVSKKDLRAIRRQCRNAGAVSTLLIGRQLKKSPSLIRTALIFHGYISLDDEWLTVSSNQDEPINAYRSPYQTSIFKMLSICGPLSLELIRQGLQNHVSRFDFAVAPTQVFRRLLLLYGFQLDNESLVTSTRSIRVAPNSSERIVLDLIQQRGPVVNYYELSKEFHHKGLSQPALSVTLRYSVLFQHVDSGLYSLRGAKIRREDIESALTRRPEVEQNSSLSFTSEGIIIYEINVGAFAVGGTIAAGEAARLTGEWKAMVEKMVVGHIKVNNIQIWGLGKAFRILGVKIGDRIALHFNTEIHQVQVVKLKDRDGKG